MPRPPNLSKPRRDMACPRWDSPITTCSQARWSLLRHADRRGVQPILGLEIDFEGSPLHLLATSFEGWSNLCRLSSAFALQDSSCSLGLFASHSRDLIALSGNPKPLMDIFGDRLYFALHDPAKGGAMLFLTLEDLHGTLDAILFPDAYHAVKSLLGSSAPLLVTGIMEMDTSRGESYWRAEKVTKLG